MNTEDKIKEILDKIRPYLNNDDGDLEFIKYEDNIVYISMKGKCASCPMADMEIKNSIELVLTSEIPEIKEVKRID